MPDQKLTDLTPEVALPANLDLYGVDRDDDTDDPKGSSVRIPFELIRDSLGSGSTEAEITQAGHGFAVLTPIYHDGSQWQPARANSGLTTAQGVVVEVIDANTFKYAITGRYTVTAHGLNPNSYYFVSDGVAGNLTLTEPLISQPIVFVEDANTIVVHGYRPQMAAGDAGETIATVKVPVPISFVAGEYTIDLANHQDGERFVVEGGLKSDASGVEAYALLEVNGDTNQSNYRRQNLLASSGAGNDSQGADNYIATLPGSASPVDSEAQYRLTIEAYSDTGYTRALGSWITLESATVLSNGSYAVAHKVASAVTQIKIKSDSGASLSGTLHAYIEKQIVIPNWHDIQVHDVEYPVVQSAYFAEDGSLLWSSEPGWSASLSGTEYTVTFPTEANDIFEQVIVSTPDTKTFGAQHFSDVSDVTKATCVISVVGLNTTEVTNRRFWVIRRLPNRKVSTQIAVGAAANPNLLINSNAKINQREILRSAAPDGSYWADRWYRVDATTDRQYVEYEGPASHVTLSWEGGGTGSINGKTGPSPLTAWIPADTQVQVDLPDGWNYSKLEIGLVATPWCLAGNNMSGEELLCRRYYWKPDLGTTYYGLALSEDDARLYKLARFVFQVRMRVAPTISYTATSAGGAWSSNFPTIDISNQDYCSIRLDTPNAWARVDTFEAEAEIYP